MSLEKSVYSAFAHVCCIKINAEMTEVIFTAVHVF